MKDISYKSFVSFDNLNIYLACNLSIIILIVLLFVAVSNLLKIHTIMILVSGLVLIFFVIILDWVRNTLLEIDKRSIKIKVKKHKKKLNRECILQIEKELEVYIDLLKLDYNNPTIVSFAEVLFGFFIGVISELTVSFDNFIMLLVMAFIPYAAMDTIKQKKKYKLFLYKYLINELKALN